MIFIIYLALFSSCKKGLDEVEYPSTIYIPQSGLSEHTVLLGESTYSLGVYKSGVNNKVESTIKIVVDTEAFGEFILSNPSYELLPEKYFSIPNNEVLMGEEDENIPFNIHLKNIDEDYINKNYVLPISIVSASNGLSINPDKSSAFLHFSRFRNLYEGQYRIKGVVFPIDDPTEIRKIDQVTSPISETENILRISGPEAGMNLLLVISNNGVKVEGASGSEDFLIQDSGASTYSGQFDSIYQRFKGEFKLNYTYTLNDKKVNAIIEMGFIL